MKTDEEKIQDFLTNAPSEFVEEYKESMVNLELSIKSSFTLFEENIVSLSIDLAAIKVSRDFKLDPITPTYFFHRNPHKVYVPDSQKPKQHVPRGNING